MKFQWSKVASVLGSYQDFIHAYGMSINSANFSEGQIAAQLDTISRKMEQLKATMTGIATGIGASGLSAYIKNILSSLNSFAQAMQRIPSQTYEMIGAFVKWGLILASSVAIIRTLVKGIYGIRAAYLIATTAQAANTASTTVNTFAKAKNYALSLLGINAARTQAAASVAAAGGLTAEAVAATEASAATGGFAATVTAATGGLNLILAAIAAAVVAFLGYNTVVGTAIEETDSLAQKQADAITAQEQNIQNLEAQKEFIGTLCEAHVKLQEALDTSKEGTEQHTKAEEDLKATDKELAEIIGEDAASNIDWSRNVQDVIKDEQAVFTNKINNEKQKLAEMQRAQIEYTQNQINWTRNRIEALKNEGYGWDALKDVIEKFVRFLGQALVYYGESLRGIQNSIRETPIIGQIAKMSGFGDVGSFSHTAINSIIAKGQQMQSFSGQPIIDSMKNLPFFGKVWQGMIDHFYGFSGIMGSHSNRENELKYQEDDLKRLEKELTDQKIAYYQQRVDNAKDNDSGIVSDDPTKDKKGTKGTKAPRGAREADNSPEAMGYRYLTGKGLDKNMVLGILANIAHESSFNPDATNGDHWGMIQWDSDRWGRFLDEYLSMRGMSQSDYYSSDVSTKRALQYDYIVHEMTKGTERGSYQKILDAVPSTPEQWAHLINMHYERSGVYSGGTDWERQKTSREYAERFGRRNGELNYTDGEKAAENAYKKAKKLFDLELQRLQAERQREGQKVSAEEELRLYEKMMGIGNGKNPYAIVESAQKDYAQKLTAYAKYEATRQEDIRKATDTQVQAVEKMADSEIEFAEKLGLLSKSDVRKYQWDKNESNYAKQKPLLESKLAATVAPDKGTADDMLAAYRGYVYAKTDLDAKYYAEKMFNLSRDVDATEKALSEMYKLEQSYHEKRVKLEQEAFLEKDKYTLKFIDSMTNAIQSGLEGILTRTKSFGEAFRDIFKSVVNDIIKMFTEDLSKSIKKWLSNLLHPQKKTGNPAGVYGDIDGGIGGITPYLNMGGSSIGGKKSKGGMGGGAFDLIGWAQSSLSSLGGGLGMGTGKGKGNVLVNALGLNNFASSVKSAVQPGLNMLRQQTLLTINGISNISQTGMQTISAGVQTGALTISGSWGTMEATRVATTQMSGQAIVAENQATAATVQATTAQMMGWLMAVLALFSLFGGGGGSSTSESTTAINLGRSPDSYYMTPTPVLQSTTFNVPSFDIGGNIEQDMFAMVHKGEMVLTPEQADVIRNTARNGGSLGGNMGGSNANIKSNISVSTVDSRGFERVLKDYNRQLSKNVKKGIRNGYLNAKGLV